MSLKVFSDEALAAAYTQAKGNKSETARILGAAPKTVRERLEKNPELKLLGALEFGSPHPQRIDLNIAHGIVVIGSDAHIWPGELSTAMRALIDYCANENPDLLVLNGDVYDGAKISKWPSIGWEAKPTPLEEIVACQATLAPLVARRKIWTFGNHDWRFESYIAKHAEHLAGLPGMHLKDYFPDWEPCWRVRVNGIDGINIKHRAPGSNPLTRGRNAGTSIATGHLHSMNAVRFSDYRGAHFSIDTGTLARIPGEINVPQFTPYTEDNPVDWASGFVVLTFHGGRLLWPEFVHVVDEEIGLISWRGELRHV